MINTSKWFSSMNYSKIYNNIIEKRTTFPVKGYSEMHHIVPRSLGGSDDKSNIVSLTAREHFICHLLLTKIYASGPMHFKMVRAFMMMFVSNSLQQRYNSSRSYAKLKEEWSKIISESQSGNGNSQYGKMWISNPNFNISIKINKTDLIPKGYYPGRNLKWKTCSNCNLLHYQTSKWCTECKEEEKNKPKKIKIASKPKVIKPRISKMCPVCNNTFTNDENKKYCSKKCSLTNGNHAVARKVIDDTGKVFNTLTEASKFYNISVEGIRYRIQIGKYKYLEDDLAGDASLVLKTSGA